ncbi:MAG TPA: TonB-dependent receptor, partial [Bacteroidia bacterium]|nr:TonB-dependent receptor [Bacteroidia bacterium]
IFIPQLNLGTTSDVNGKFKITPIPKGTYEVEIEILGYSTITKQITIKNDTCKSKCNCAMCASCNSANEVVITALGNITNIQRSPIPVTIVSHEAMLQKTSNTVIDAIADQPGVNETTEGAGTTKPQINGLGFNRVLVLMDGEPQEDFQWGDDHGILIDSYSVYDAEIIRGPASLQYGSSAEAGVISFKSQPFAESGTVKGSVLAEYQTNNGLIGNSENVSGNNNGFVWDLRASNEEAHSYWNPKDGYVWGTAWQQENARLRIGLNKSWGFTRLTVSALHRRIQVPDGNRDSATGQFEFDAPQNGQLFPNKANFLSYDPSIAGDKILDEYQTWWQNSFNVGTGNIGLDVGFTQSVHHDIDSGSVGEGNMIVNDIPYSLKYQVIEENSGIKLTTGVNGTYEFEHNLVEPPAPYIGNFEIPNYTNFEIGAYAILEKDFKNLTLSGGLRYDMTNFIGQSMYLSNVGTPEQTIVSATTTGASEQFEGFNNTYSGPSGSIGASYQLRKNNYVKLNFSKSYRAPAINELTSNGLNIGSNAYQLGDINLKAEQGYEVDVAYGNNGKDVSFEADGFYNYINNFIFADRTDSSLSGFPVFPTVSNTAIITGVSGYFNIHPTNAKWLEIDNGFTYIYSYLPNQTDSTNHVPWTPAPHLTTEIKFKLKDKPNSILKGIYIEFGQAKYWAQNNIYSALYTELPSAAYTLYNAGIGTNFVNQKTKKVICSLYINCTNLTNIAYADHLNLAQYFLSYNGELATVTKQNQGVYNMGRNVGFKLIFPFGGN